MASRWRCSRRPQKAERPHVATSNCLTMKPRWGQTKPNRRCAVEGKGKYASLAVLVGVLGSLLTALATHGEKTLAVLGGVPKILAAWSSGLPLGTGSWFIAVVLGTGLWLFIIPRLPRMADGGRAHLMADNVVIP